MSIVHGNYSNTNHFTQSTQRTLRILFYFITVKEVYPLICSLNQNFSNLGMHKMTEISTQTVVSCDDNNDMVFSWSSTSDILIQVIIMVFSWSSTSDILIQVIVMIFSWSSTIDILIQVIVIVFSWFSTSDILIQVIVMIFSWSALASSLYRSL